MGERDELIRISGLTFGGLRRALETIPEDKLDWSPAEGALGPADQVLHACGADRSYADHIDGGKRPTSFDLARELRSKQELLAHLDETNQMVHHLIAGLSSEELERVVDIPWRPDATVRFVLLHMLRHRHYHLGQLNLLRHLLGLSV